MGAEKKIESYLPLYLGCEVMIGESERKTLLGLIPNRKEVFVQWGDIVGWRNMDSARLLLRPLSDMKEEEFEEFKVITGYPNHNATFEGAGGHLIWYRYGKKLNVSGFKTSIDINRIRPVMLHFLLKQGFDLFGLIEAGIALDKTTLNKG